jgi:hypothetical protein
MQAPRSDLLAGFTFRRGRGPLFEQSQTVAIRVFSSLKDQSQGLTPCSEQGCDIPSVCFISQVWHISGGKSSNLPELRNAISKVRDHITGPIAVFLHVLVGDLCVNSPHGQYLSIWQGGPTAGIPADNDPPPQLLRSLGVFLCLALCCFLSMVLFFWP